MERTIAKGLENAPKAVIGLFKEDFGKMLIKIGLEV